MRTIRPLDNLHRVYCAGPLFNEAERREMLAIADVLRGGGLEPFVPHADGMEFAQLQPYLIEQGYEAAAIGQCLHEAVFALDVYQVAVGCGSLVFNMNGRVPDEGAVAEATIAWMLGKPVVLFKEDARSAIAGRDNPLIVGQCGFRTVNRLDKLHEALADCIARHESDSKHETSCPPHVARTMAAGERLWQQLERLGPDRHCAPVAEVVLELFGPVARLDRNGVAGDGQPALAR